MNVGDGSPQSGGTFRYNPKRNFVASDVASNSLNKDIGVFGVFIHEVANSIEDQYGLADPYGGYAKQNAKHGIGDPDVGAAFETCVFGGLVGFGPVEQGDIRSSVNRWFLNYMSPIRLVALMVVALVVAACAGSVNRNP
jgi:hypothetical protein